MKTPGRHNIKKYFNTLNSNRFFKLNKYLIIIKFMKLEKSDSGKSVFIISKIEKLNNNNNIGVPKTNIPTPARD